MNAVVVIGIGRDQVLDLSMQTVERYCEKYSLPLEVIKKAKYGYENRPHYRYINFEKNQVYDLLGKYDRILRLDSDVLITASCPDIFEEFPEDCFTAVPEDVGDRKTDREHQMEIAQEELGLTLWDRYFNSGVVLASKQHKEAFNIQEYNLYNKYLGDYKEQTLLNWRVANLKYKTYWASHKYNHLSMFSEDIRNSYIIHYAGGQAEKPSKMKNDLEWIIPEWENN